VVRKSGEALMVEKYTKMLRKLDRPPAGPNWVRFIHGDAARTAKAIVAFAMGQPQFSYQPGYAAIKDRIELGIDREAAIRIASERGSPAGRVQNKEFVEAFFEYDETRKFSASNPIDFETEYFRVSREVRVPVAPLSIIRERGRFVPIFACGWRLNPLAITQRRLLMTIYEDAFLSLTDYQKSPAEVLFFPKSDAEEKPKREPEVWKRGDYALLTKSELDECVETFVSARDMARAVLLAEIERLKQEAEKERPATEEGAEHPDLFRKK
jgi:hypothetical protein